jgi:integrase
MATNKKECKTKFYLRNPNSSGETPIVLSVHFNGNRYRCGTDLKIEPEKWNIDRGEPLPIKENQKKIKRLNTLAAFADDAYYYFRDTVKDLNPDTVTFQTKFYEYVGIEKKETAQTEKPKYTLFQFIDKFIIEAKQRQNEHTGAKISVNTIKMYNQCKRLLKEFNDTRYRIDFNKLSLDFFLDFKEFLNNNQYATNTIAKHIITLKTFLNDANERGYYNNLAHKSKRFRAIQVQSRTIYLTENELDEIYKLDLSKKPKLDRARDLFLVGCYTGLRFSDFTNIQPENIQGGFIEITTQKTGETVVIPIHTRVNSIMAKYEGKYINSLPPAISNQKLNDYLKELCALVPSLNTPFETEQRKNPNDKTKGPKLTKPKMKFELVSTHTARRSFATNNYNNGISANILMKITGHKTERSFYKYIRVTPKENAQRLRELWNMETSYLKVV